MHTDYVNAEGTVDTGALRLIVEGSWEKFCLQEKNVFCAWERRPIAFNDCRYAVLRGSTWGEKYPFP